MIEYIGGFKRKFNGDGLSSDKCDMDTLSSSRNIGKRVIKNDGQVSRGAKRRCFKKDQLKEDVRQEYFFNFSTETNNQWINQCLLNAWSFWLNEESLATSS